MWMSEPRTVFIAGEADRGKRLDHFLREKIPGLSRTRLQGAIRARVTLSWEARPRPATSVRPGGEVLIGYLPVPEELMTVELSILGHGAGWLAIDKPPGIPVHPVNRVRENSLIRILRRQEACQTLRLVHRLDRETSGVLLVAEDAPVASFLSRAFERGDVLKEYLAVVRGVPREDEGVVNLPVGEAHGSRVFTRRGVQRDGQSAATAWRVERRLADRALLRVFPRTGRRHQIRVHLAALGHPILGDLLYGRPDDDYLDLVRGIRDARREQEGPCRQLLHCARLVFPDPCGGARIDVSSPPPADFCEGLRGALDLEPPTRTP